MKIWFLGKILIMFVWVLLNFSFRYFLKILINLSFLHPEQLRPTRHPSINKAPVVQIKRVDRAQKRGQLVPILFTQITQTSNPFVVVLQLIVLKKIFQTTSARLILHLLSQSDSQSLRQQREFHQNSTLVSFNVELQFLSELFELYKFSERTLWKSDQRNKFDGHCVNRLRLGFQEHVGVDF